MSAKTIPIKPEPYCPSNSTEGDGFFNDWCHHCARDLTMSEGKHYDDCEENEICKIIGDTMAYKIADPEYPKEWIKVDGVPTCTAFVQAGNPIPLRDDLTIDMFEVQP
jgi:hypothetical protein